MEAVDAELLTDPERLEAHMDAAIERERASFQVGYRVEAAKTLSDRIAKLEARRGGYEEMCADGEMSRERFRERVAALDEERDAAEIELTRVRETAGRVGEMKQAKRAVLEMF